MTDDDVSKYDRLKAIGQEMQGVGPDGNIYFGPIDPTKTYIVNKWEMANGHAPGRRR